MSEEKLEPLFLGKEDIDLFATEMGFKGIDLHLQRMAQKMAINSVASMVFRDQRRYDLCEETLRFNHRMLFPSLSDKDIERALDLLVEYYSHLDSLIDLSAMSGPDAISTIEKDPRWEVARKTAIQYGLCIGMKTNDATQYAIAVVDAGKSRMANIHYAEKKHVLIAEGIFLKAIMGGMEVEWLKRQSNLAIKSVEDYRQFSRKGLVKSLDDSAEYYYALLYGMKYPGARSGNMTRRAQA
jgi:hypothetical protein